MRTVFSLFPEKLNGKFRFKSNCVLHRWVIGISFYFKCNSWNIGVNIKIGPFMFVFEYDLEEVKTDKYSFPRFLRTGHFKYIPEIVSPLDNYWYEPEYVPDEHNSLDIIWFQHLEKKTDFFDDVEE